MEPLDFVPWLIATARAKHMLRSDRELARYMRCAHSLLTSWRAGERIPSDENIVKLCKLASFPPEAGLTIINMVRSPGVPAAIYGRLLRKAGYDFPDPKSHQNAA